MREPCNPVVQRARESGFALTGTPARQLGAATVGQVEITLDALDARHGRS
jgi:hypothetical protein